MEKKITIASKLLLLLIFIFGVCSGSSLAAKSDVSYADEKQLTLNAENITIQQAIQKIQDQSEFDFFYKNVDLEKTQKKVSFAFEGKTIHEVLPELLAGTNLAYKVMEKDIVIFPSSSETVKEDESSVQEAGQQQIEVFGTVTDAQTDEPLPGVNIVVQGTTTGTTTNMDGEYTIEAPADATLVFSFVGYQEQTVEIDGREEINIAMEQATTELEEVVAIGYGTARKEDLTGSITSADPSVTQEMPNTNVLQSLHGNLAGLDIGATDAAGESPSIKVRGYSTLSTSASANQPLIVVDGSIYRGNISDLNTADIESIDVLKGVSATAVYGSQASNGVMIISTKEGTDEVTEKPILSYSAKYSYKTPNEHALEPMSADEHREFIRDVHWQDGYLSPDYTEEDPEFDPKDHLRSGDVAEGFEAGIDPGWYDNFTSDGYLNNHNLSIRGKSEKLSYFASAGYTDEQGYHYNDQYSKYNFRINLDFEINDWMSIGLKSFLANSDYSGYEINLFTMMPYSPIYESPGDPDSGYRLETGHNQLNPYLSKQRDDSDKRLNLRANPTLDIDFPFIQGLTYRVSYTNNYRDRKHYHFNEYGSTGYVGC